LKSLFRHWVIPERQAGGRLDATRYSSTVDDQEACDLVRQVLGDEEVVTGATRIGRTWVVSHQSRTFVESGDVRYIEAGPGPMLVSDSGSVVGGPGTTPAPGASRRTLDEAVAEFERQRPG